MDSYTRALSTELCGHNKAALSQTSPSRTQLNKSLPYSDHNHSAETTRFCQVLAPRSLTFGFRRLVDAHLVQLLNALGSLLRRGIDDERRASKVVVARICRVRAKNALMLGRLRSNLDSRRGADTFHGGHVDTFNV